MTRNLLLALFALAHLGGAFAQGSPPTETVSLNLQAALKLAPEVDPELLDAQRDLETAERDLVRSQADPQALGLDLLAAEQAVAAARDAVKTATLAAELEIATAYTDLLDIEYTLAQAEIESEIATTTLEATRARHQAGAATELEVVQAENTQASNERTAQEIRIDRDLAVGALQGLLGTSIAGLTPIMDSRVPESPILDEVLAATLERNTRLLAAERAVESARAQLAAVDNALSARAEIEAARDAVTSAETSLRTLRSNLELSIQQTYASVSAAGNRLVGAEEAYATSLENLEGQRARLEAGSISALAFREAELSTLASEASLASARHALMLAHMQLESAVLE